MKKTPFTHSPLLIMIAFSFLAPPLAFSGTQKDFFQNGDLNNANNYNPTGTPGSGSDVLLTTTSTALTLSGASLSMNSLNQTNNTAYTISSGSLSLGPLSANVVSPNGSDAIYLGASASSLTLDSSVSLQLAAGNLNVAQAGAALSISGSIAANPSNVSLTKTGAGTLNLSGSFSAFGGALALNGGTTNFLAGFTDVTPLRTLLFVNNMNTGPGSAVILNVQTSAQFEGLRGSIAAPSSGTNTATVNLVGASTELHLEGAVSPGGAYAGTIAGAGRVSINLTSAGSEQTFSGNDTYTGTTTINGGTVRINGNTSGQGNYTVSTTSASGATLTGSGTIGLAINGTITIGGSVASNISAGGNLATGTLNVTTSGTGGVIFGSQSVFIADIGPAGASDLLAIAGGYIDLTGSADKLTLNSLSGAFDGSVYTIATFTQNLSSGTFNTVTGLPANYVVSYSSNSIRLLPVPEPTSLSLTALALAIVAYRVKRGRSR